MIACPPIIPYDELVGHDARSKEVPVASCLYEMACWKGITTLHPDGFFRPVLRLNEI
jgi:hypothetical protein